MSDSMVISRLDGHPVAQPPLSEHWKKHKSLTPTRVPQHLFFIYRWTPEGRIIAVILLAFRCCLTACFNWLIAVIHSSTVLLMKEFYFQLIIFNCVRWKWQECCCLQQGYRAGSGYPPGPWQESDRCHLSSRWGSFLPIPSVHASASDVVKIKSESTFYVQDCRFSVPILLRTVHGAAIN